MVGRKNPRYAYVAAVPSPLPSRRIHRIACSHSYIITHQCAYTHMSITHHSYIITHHCAHTHMSITHTFIYHYSPLCSHSYIITHTLIYHYSPLCSYAYIITHTLIYHYSPLCSHLYAHYAPLRPLCAVFCVCVLQKFRLLRAECCQARLPEVG